MAQEKGVVISMVSSFTPVQALFHRRLVANVAGLDKSGKTHQALSAPGPVYVFNFDMGLGGVADKFLAQGKQIYESRYQYSVNTDTGWLDLWLRFKREFAEVLQALRNGPGTIVVDAATEVRELARLAFHGKVSGIRPRSMGPMNADMNEVFRPAVHPEVACNVIFIQKMGPKWVNDARTEEYEVKGWEEFIYLAQANLRVWRDDAGWHLYVVNCRQNMTLCGLDVPGADFNILLDMVFG